MPLLVRVLSSRIRLEALSGANLFADEGRRSNELFVFAVTSSSFQAIVAAARHESLSQFLGAKQARQLALTTARVYVSVFSIHLQLAVKRTLRRLRLQVSRVALRSSLELDHQA